MREFFKIMALGIAGIIMVAVFVLGYYVLVVLNEKAANVVVGRPSANEVQELRERLKKLEEKQR